MIESKVSRSDFKADAKKPERLFGGVGTYRFYITPLNMLLPEELPEGWGLPRMLQTLTATARRHRRTH